MGYSRFVDVAAPLRASLDLALARFGYLFPECVAKPEDSGVRISAPDQAGLDEAARQLRYLIYREKISQDARPTRERMFRSLFGS